MLFLLARATAAKHQDPEASAGGDSLLPQEWFYKSPQISFNKYCQLAKLPFTSCRTWDDLKHGLDLDNGPQISIFYPQHASFEVYDVIVLYSEDKQVHHLHGYQCTEGKANSGQKVDPEFTRSFVLKGDTPDTSSIRDEWLIPSAKHIEDFFGVSGKLWTPKEWRRLLLTLNEDP